MKRLLWFEETGAGEGLKRYTAFLRLPRCLCSVFADGIAFEVYLVSNFQTAECRIARGCRYQVDAEKVFSQA